MWRAIKRVRAAERVGCQRGQFGRARLRRSVTRLGSAQYIAVDLKDSGQTSLSLSLIIVGSYKAAPDTGIPTLPIRMLM